MGCCGSLIANYHYKNPVGAKKLDVGYINIMPFFIPGPLYSVILIVQPSSCTPNILKVTYYNFEHCLVLQSIPFSYFNACLLMLPSLNMRTHSKKII